MNHTNFARYRRVIFSSAAAAVVLFLGAPGYAQAPQVPPVASSAAPKPLAERLMAMEKEIEKQRIAAGIPGAALVVVQGDQVIYLKGLGLRDVARKRSVTPDTLFAIGSSTKAFTATAVLMSQDDGKLSLDDSPKKVLPYFKLQDAEADKNITIRDLMCHDSGLARVDYAWIGGFLTREEGIRLLADVTPTAPFRKKFQYQNLMFCAAGEIAARVQKMPYERLIESRIFAPLGMNHSNLSVKTMQKTADYAIGYAPDPKNPGSTVLPMRDIDAVAPAGAINSSARDMAQWLRFLLQGGVAANGKRLLSEASFAEMVKPQMTVAPKVMDYGLGWFVRKWHGLTVIEHGGNIDGFNAEVAFMPEKNLGFVLLTNVTTSPLAQSSLDAVWSNLVDLPPDAKDDKRATPEVATSGPTAAPKEEVGTYSMAGAPLKVTVALAEDKLTLTVPGQPTYPLERLTGRRYKLASPAPDGFFITFQPAKDKPTETEASLEQPNGTFLLKKEAVNAAPFVSPIPVEELLAKMVEAAGGETVLRGHKTAVIKSRLTLENQGLVADVDTVGEYPNRREQRVRMFALKTKEVGRMRECFDGTRGWVESNLGSTSAQEHEGSALYDAALQSYLHPVLDARKIFPRLEITGQETRNGEDILVLKKTPVLGSPITEYVSRKTFLVLRRDTVSSGQPQSELYEDYRLVDGERIPFKTTSQNPALGKLVETVVSATFNVPIPKNAFAPASPLRGKETAQSAKK